jgi:FlaA1/EpsC-like NDP-sugar epimerase
MTKYIHRNFFIVLAIDICLLAFSWYFAHLLRFNFDIPPDTEAVMTRVIPIILFVKIITFYLFDLYKGMWRYTSLDDLVKILKAGSVGSLILVSIIAFTHAFAGFSRATFIIDWFLTLFFVAGYRVGIRIFFWIGLKERGSRLVSLALFGSEKRRRHAVKRLLILGAGDCGEKIFREIRDNASLRYRVVGFLDDNEMKVGKQIHGVPVLGTTHDLKKVAERVRAHEALIAIPSGTGRQMRSIVEL